MTLLQSPVRAIHETLGASFAPFGGWEMPISYQGVVSEHTAVRERVGLFDVSHLGKVKVSGPGAADYVNSALTNDLRRITPGRAQYTLCCTEQGGVVDDLIAYLLAEDEVFLVPNAANSATVAGLLVAKAPAGVRVEDQHQEFGVFAVQGPNAADVLAALGLPTDMPYMGFVDANWTHLDSGATGQVRVCRTGYTGEHGYELLPPWQESPALFGALLEAVTAAGGQVAGLGARDTLRTEMGYPLHGHELSTDITPVQARCGWAVGWKKDTFWGKEALVREKAEGPARALWGLKASGRGVLRPDLAVLKDGAPIGQCTSGTFSPTLKAGIGLALLDTAAQVEAGDQVTVDVRGRALLCEVVAPPFVPARIK